jgi:hypothetical protein
LAVFAAAAGQSHSTGGIKAVKTNNDKLFLKGL